MLCWKNKPLFGQVTVHWAISHGQPKAFLNTKGFDTKSGVRNDFTAPGQQELGQGARRGSVGKH